MKSYIAKASQRDARQRRIDADAVLAQYRKVRERKIKQIIEQLCEKAQIPYMRNRDVKLIKTRDGRIIPAPIGESQLGKPDLTVVALDGRTIWIETKAPNGDLEPNQLFWKEQLEKRGHEYYSPRSIDEAHAVGKRILEIGR